jgi:membrane protein
MNPVEVIKRVITFLTVDIWKVPLEDLSRARAMLVNQLRILVLSLRGFQEDKLNVRASALTYYTLLSVVPVVAIVFGIAKGFGFEKMIEDALYNNYPGYETVIGKIVEYANSLLENTQGGILAGVGIVVLLYTLIKVLGNFEAAFNDIWNLHKDRSFVRKFSDYTAIMIITTVAMVIYNSFAGLLSSRLMGFLDSTIFKEAQGPLSWLLFNILPFILIWGLLTFIYIVLPNTRVSFKSAFYAAVVAGTLYRIVQWIYISFQIGVSRHNAIYGSLAALPLFLIWIQLSWLIVLVGAEISFAIQNVNMYKSEIDSLHINWRSKMRLGLLVAWKVVRNFADGYPPMTAAQIAEDLGMPVRLARQVLSELADEGMFSKVEQNKGQDSAFQPACDLNYFSVKCVVDTLERLGSDDVPVKESPQFSRLTAIMNSFSDAMDNSPENILLKDI